MFECIGVSGSVFIGTRDAPAEILVRVLLSLAAEVGGSLVGGRFLFGGMSMSTSNLFVNLHPVLGLCASCCSCDSLTLESVSGLS